MVQICIRLLQTPFIAGSINLLIMVDSAHTICYQEGLMKKWKRKNLGLV
jgi:hypothetical protein